MLEQVRRRMRLLVTFIVKGKRNILYADFTDSLGETTEVGLSGLVAADEFERFRRKTRQFLLENKGQVAAEKIHPQLAHHGGRSGQVATGADRERDRERRRPGAGQRGGWQLRGVRQSIGRTRPLSGQGGLR